jgi:hypothetical protein
MDAVYSHRVTCTYVRQGLMPIDRLCMGHQETWSEFDLIFFYGLAPIVAYLIILAAVYCTKIY